MQFIRLQKPMDIAERVLAELVADQVENYSVQRINIIVLWQLQVILLVSWVIEWSKRWMPHWRTFGNLTHRAWAIWDLSNHDLFRIIPNPGSQQRVTLSLESICTIQFQARASDVKIPKLRQHSSNRRIPGFVIILGTFQGTWDQPAKNPGALFSCAVYTFWNITNCEIERPGMLIARIISQLILVGCTYDWPNRRSCKKLILCIPPPMTRVYLAVDSITFRVSEGHRFEIEVRMKWEICHKEMDTFENIPVV